VTELVYRHQIRPVIQSGATIMDRLFGSPADRRAAEAVAGQEPSEATGERNSLSATLVTQLAHVPLSGRPFWAENGAVVVW
jgi:hypothetical protein